MSCMRSVTRTAKFKLAFASPFLQKCGTVDFVDFQPIQNHWNIATVTPESQPSHDLLMVENQVNQQFHTFAKWTGKCQLEFGSSGDTPQPIHSKVQNNSSKKFKKVKK